MVRFCTSCGSANPPDSRFCAKCGGVIAVASATLGPTRVEPPTEAPLISHANMQTKMVEPSREIPDENQPARNWILVGTIVGTILLIGALYFWLFVSDDLSQPTSSSQGTSIEAGEAAASIQMFTTTQANIRDKPTTAGSNILGKLPRGSAVTGLVKLGEDGISEWMELEQGKGFVGVVNLSETQPPEFTRALNDKTWTSDVSIDIWSQPDTTSTLVDRVSEGTKLTLAGLTANDFIEIKLPKGGVGYVTDGAAILDRLNGRPITISFNPASCTFGAELDSEFAKIAAKLKAQWIELESKEFVDDTAREKAYAASESKSSYVKLQRSFAGLSLTAIAQHFESQSLYFADPPSKVIEIFRSKGFKIGRDGTFASTELYAGISATRGEGAAYGKSELGCGV